MTFVISATAPNSGSLPFLRLAEDMPAAEKEPGPAFLRLPSVLSGDLEKEASPFTQSF